MRKGEKGRGHSLRGTLRCSEMASEQKLVEMNELNQERTSGAGEREAGIYK